MLPDKFYDHLLLRGLESITIDGYKKALNMFLKTIGSEKPKREQAENYLLEMRKKGLFLQPHSQYQQSYNGLYEVYWKTD